MKCAECDTSFGQRPIHLQQGSDQISFCSFECLIGYAVGRVRQRLQFQNRRVRVLARRHVQTARSDVRVHATRRLQP